MRLHVIGMPHTETTSEFVTCAYTQKIVKFGEMMLQQGHEVFIYSGEENEAQCTEHVPLFTKAEREGWYGKFSPNWTWGGLTWNPEETAWKVVNHRAISEISKRIENPRDLILLVMGTAQRPIAEAFHTVTSCEYGVGYEGAFSPFVCYESYAWMHYLYGKYPHLRGQDGGRWYDCVIPNYFRKEDFQDREGPGGGYLLFLGRVTRQKGPQIAAEIADRVGMPLVIAGPGATNPEHGVLLADGGQLELRGGHISYTGPVGTEVRTGLLREAAAILCPTTYLEPFGGMAVEAMMSGTPAVTSDWGAFPETVEEGLTGFRFRRIQEGVRAVEAALELPRATIRKRAIERFSLEAVGPQFARWFERLDGLWDNDFYGGVAPPPLKAIRTDSPFPDPPLQELERRLLPAL